MGYWLNKHNQIQTSLIKIQIGGSFWFEDDLSFVNNKTHPNNTKDDERWERIKKRKSYKEWQNDKQFSMGLGFRYQMNGYKIGTLETSRV